jgi:hypothetical protein
MKSLVATTDEAPDLDTPVAFDESEAYELVEDLNRAAQRFEWKTIQPTLSRLLTMLPGMKKVIYKFKNTVTSVREGLESDTLMQKAAKEELADAYKELSFSIGIAIGELKRGNDLPEKIANDLDTRTLKTYDKNMNAVQSRIQRDGTFAGYVPVLTITTPPLSVRKLNAKGILATNFADYPILNKQFVIGVSNDYVRGLMPAMKTQDKEKISKAFADTREQAIQEVVEIVSKKFSSMKLVQIAEPIYWWDATWIWMMNSKEMEMLKQCTIVDSKVLSFLIKKWSFPFENRK